MRRRAPRFGWSFAGALVAASLLAQFSAACATRGVSSVLAPRDEYALYRRSRVAPTIDERLVAAERYLRENPSGRFHREVSDWFGPAEERYFVRAWNSVPALERYLRALPEGPHAGRAEERIAELALAQEYAERREARSSERFSKALKALADADAGRKNLGRHVQRWLAHLMSLGAEGGWGARTHELTHEFIFAYRMQEPEAVCGPDQCVKQLLLAYSVPTPAGLLERRAELLIVLHLRDGGIRGASLAGKALFTRLGEALLLRAVDDDDPQARAEVIARSVQFLQNSIQTELPFDGCARDVVSPVVVHRRCRGLDVMAVAGETSSDLDRVDVTPFDEPSNDSVPALRQSAPTAPADQGARPAGAKPGTEGRPEQSKP